MPPGPPALVSLDPDDYQARHAGHLPDGRQFFLTNPFVPAIQGSPGREFVALYLFDSAGKLLEARIVDLGTRANLKKEDWERQFAKMLDEVGDFDPRRIEIKPFEVERFGVAFGFIPRPPEEDGNGWWVEVMPGNFMAFHEPWDSGEYDT
jgi:hypothetical protein